MSSFKWPTDKVVDQNNVKTGCHQNGIQWHKNTICKGLDILRCGHSNWNIVKSFLQNGPIQVYLNVYWYSNSQGIGHKNTVADTDNCFHQHKVTMHCTKRSPSSSDIINDVNKQYTQSNSNWNKQQSLSGYRCRYNNQKTPWMPDNNN